MINTKSKGNVLVVVLIIVMSFAIMIPSIVSFVRNEAKWSVKEGKQTAAFHLAEAAHDRGYWKLSESTNNWSTITSGVSIAGYANDVVYTDVTGGSYKINIYKISGSSVGILATAKDSAGKEFRAIRSIYSKNSITAAMQAPSYSSGGNAKTNWGPIYSQFNIYLSGTTSNAHYPRKMAVGSIENRDTDINTLPNVDPLGEWWSYNTYPVPAPPVIDLPTYATAASATGTYFTDANHSFKNYKDTVGSARKVYYCSNGAASVGGSGTFINGDLIVQGNCNIQSQGAVNYVTTPPAEAWREYVVDTPAGGPDDINPDQYLGDGGYHVVKSCTLSGVAVKGLIYVSGTFSAGANTVIHGAIVVGGSGSAGGGGDLYYDDSLVVLTTSNAMGTRTSWKEETAVPF